MRDWVLTTVVAVRDEVPGAVTYVLRLPDGALAPDDGGAPAFGPLRAGQHVDLRLTAEDGYQAQRSYSVASPPEDLARDRTLSLTVEYVEGGEVSPYLLEHVEPGARLEVRGPVGGHFVWEAPMGGPLLLVGGGSGVVPLAAIARHRALAAPDVPARLVVSVQSVWDVLYRDEWGARVRDEPAFDVALAITRRPPRGWGEPPGRVEPGHNFGPFAQYARRVDAEMLAEVAAPLGGAAAVRHAYVCGPTPFVEAAADALVALGMGPESVRTERFGPSGTVPVGFR